MKKVVLLGGGGHCRSVLDSLLKLKQYEEIAILDQEEHLGEEILGCRVVGTDQILPNLKKHGFEDAFITVGSITDTTVREKILQKVKKAGFHVINIIDPTAVIAENVLFGYGVYVGKQAVINAYSRISNMAIINTASVIEHGCFVGEFVHVSAGAVLCGDVHVGNQSFIGAGATVIQGIHIGRKCFVKAGSLIKDNMDTKNGYTGGGGIMIDD